MTNNTNTGKKKIVDAHSYHSHAFVYWYHTRRGFTSASEERRESPSFHGVRAMTKQTRFGFTLIEIMVATSLFAIVMMIAVGALLSLVEANKRAQAINAVMNNVSAAMETMTRNIRVGRVYHCESTAADVSPETLASVNDCAEFGGLLFAFEPSNGGLSDSNDQTVYRLNGTQIERSLCSGVNQSCAGGTKNGAWIAITAPEIRISSLRFFVKGSPKEDGFQPRVLIVMKGEAPVPGGATTFSIQSTVAQRVLDI